MSTQLTLPAEPLAAEATREPAASVRMRWFELALLLAIAFGGFLFSSLHILITGHVSSPYSSDLRWIGSLFHEGTALLLLAYILRRRRMRLADLGLRWSFRDLLRGAGLILGSYCAYFVGYILVNSIHHAIFGAVHSGITEKAIFGHTGAYAVPFILLNPIFEEMIVRAYLMTEVMELTVSKTLAVALSVAIQTTYHLYYGWVGALSLGFQFLVFSLYYARTRRATPIILAHGFFDLLGMVRLWY